MEPDTAEVVLTGSRLLLRAAPAAHEREFTVAEAATRRTVGSARLRLGADPEIGFAIIAEARGRRYAAEASALIAEWGFGRGLARIRICCEVTNLASARSAMRAGFRFEGISRRGVTGEQARDGDGAGAAGTLQRGDLARFARLPDDPPGPVGAAFAPLPPGGVTDGVVTVRVTEPADAQGFVEQETDPLTVANGFTGHAPDAAAVVQSVNRAGLDWLTGPVGALTIVDAATGRFAGSMRLRRPGPPDVGGIGYAIHPAFRGRAYTARALRLLAAWALGAGGFVRLELGAKAANVASQKAALAAGFTHEGTIRSRLRAPDGSYADEVRFCLLGPGRGGVQSVRLISQSG